VGRATGVRERLHGLGQRHNGYGGNMIDHDHRNHHSNIEGLINDRL